MGHLMDTPQQPRPPARDSIMPAVLTIGIIAMVVAMVCALLLLPTPPENAEVIYLIAGQIIGAFSTAVAYWLGSSRGSAEKQKSLEAR